MAPFLPELLARGEVLLEEAESGALGSLRARAFDMWRRLRTPVEADAGVRKAIELAVARPDDERARAALELHIETLLEMDSSLAAQLTEVVVGSRYADVLDQLTSVLDVIDHRFGDGRLAEVMEQDIQVAKREAGTETPDVRIILSRLDAIASLAAQGADVEAGRAVVEAAESAAARIRQLYS
jgi:hypothetical protein